MGRSAKPLFGGSNPSLLSTLTLPVYDAPVVKLGRHASFRVLYRKVWGFESLQAHKAVSDGHISPTFVRGNMLNGNETALL